MPITFTCPNCRRPARASTRMAGREVDCPSCRRLIVVPGNLPAAPPTISPGAVHVEAPELPEHISPRLSALASLAWSFVVLVALVATLAAFAGCAVGIVIAARAPDPVGAVVAAGAVAFPLLLTLVGSSYVLARAIDRLTQ